MTEYTIDALVSGITDANRHGAVPSPAYDADMRALEELKRAIAAGEVETLTLAPLGDSRRPLLMPRDLTDEQADAAMRATAVHLDIQGSQLTVNRKKMKARYRALVKFIEAGNG